jgi:Ni,Fe-hydrogenase III large subunit/Ni,Fe-hydrogenase III component G
MSRLRPPLAMEASRPGLVDQVRALLADRWRLALVAAHEDTDEFRVVYAFFRAVGERCEITLSVPRSDAWIPTLADVSYPAGRFEREIRDLFGITPVGHPLPHRLVRHGHWPTGWHPMLRDAGPTPPLEPDVGSYPFGEVRGDGVYEIPVGPIHAGLIEPGHFRFSVVGETILRMKARLWFLHRGLEKLFEGRHPAAGIELAERVSGDTAVGHTVAFLMAVEDAVGIEVPEHVRARRAMLLELERLHNHIADLGAIANDVGFGIAHVHAQRLRETLLRHNKALTGHRLLRGALSLGDAQLLREPDLDLVRSVAGEAADIVGITLGHPVVSDRMTGTAVLSTQQAATIGALGYVARASGLRVDARVDHPLIDLGPGFAPVIERDGDVRARYLVRAGETAQSPDLLSHLAGLIHGPAASSIEPGIPHGPLAGLGVVEAWRGTLCHRVEIGRDGTLTRVKIVDPSWFSWPALPVALADTIVPDFPLANKSFNQSYAGNDL